MSEIIRKEVKHVNAKEVEEAIEGMTKKNAILYMVKNYGLTDVDHIASLTGFSRKLVKDYVWIMINRQGLKGILKQVK